MFVDAVMLGEVVVVALRQPARDGSRLVERLGADISNTATSDNSQQNDNNNKDFPCTIGLHETMASNA